MYIFLKKRRRRNQHMAKMQDISPKFISLFLNHKNTYLFHLFIYFSLFFSFHLVHSLFSFFLPFPHIFSSFFLLAVTSHLSALLLQSPPALFSATIVRPPLHRTGHSFQPSVGSAIFG